VGVVCAHGQGVESELCEVLATTTSAFDFFDGTLVFTFCRTGENVIMRDERRTHRVRE